MTMTRIGVMMLAASLVAPGYAWAADVKADEAALLKRDAEWSAVAYEGKDLEKILSFWADDAVVIPSGGPVADGKAAIRAFVQGALAVPGFKILAKVTVTNSSKGTTPRPAVWVTENANGKGGRAFYTIKGHSQSNYSESQFRDLMLRGILWSVHRLPGGN